MKPIELEILMKDGLTPGLKNAGRIVNQFSGETQAAFKEIQRSLKLQQEYVGKLEKELGGLENSLKGVVTGSSEWTQIKKRIEEVTKEIETEKPAIDELKDKYNELKDSAENADVSLKNQLRNLTQEIASLMLAYARLSDEEKSTAEGKALQKHIEQLTEEAGVLRDAMADTTAAINNAASDTRGFDQLSSALQLAIDGFGLATAGAEMFGMSQEDLIAVQTKLQAAIVASNALSSIQNNLQKQSALMQGIQIIQTKAGTAAENLKTAAQGRGIIATKAATVAQAAFNAVANANPYILLATACLTVVGALWAFSKGSKAAKKAEEERREEMEKVKNEQDEFARNVASNAGEQITSFLKLKRAWENLGDSFDKKKKFIADTKDEWRKLGKEIDNVNDMEMIFRDHTKDMLNAIIIRAELKAYETRIQNVASQMIEDIEKNKTYKWKPANTNTKFTDLTESEKKALSDQDSKGNFIFTGKGENNLRSVKTLSSSYLALSEEGVAIINQMRKNAGNSAALATLENVRTTAENTIKGYVDEMNRLNTQLEKTMSSVPGIAVDSSEDPKKSTGKTNPDKDNRIEYERRVAEEIQKLRWQNQQAEIDQMEYGAEKRRRQIALNYEKQIAEIQAQEDKWKEAQNGVLNQEQSETIAESLRLANEGMKQELDKVAEDEISKNREKLDELLNQYKDYDQQRRDIEASYVTDMEILTAELTRLEESGLDTTDLRSAMSARTAAYSEGINSLQTQILQSSDFYDKLFGRVADKGYKVLQDFYKQAEETLENAQVLTDGVEISIPVKDAEGKFVKQQVKITVDEYQRMLKRIQEIRKQLDKDNPFAAMKTAWSDFISATKEEGGDVSGALKELQAKGKDVNSTIKGWGESLGTVLGDNFKRSMGEIMTCCDGIMDMGSGIAQIWAGDIVGGITSALSGLASIFSLFSSWKEKMEEMKREWYIAEIETNRALRDRSAEYARNRSAITDVIKDTEMLNWLIERGYAKPESVSVWDSESEALDEYMENLRKEMKIWDELWEKVQGSQGHYEWGNSLNGGWATWSLKGFNEDMIELWYNQGKLSDEAKAYYEAWKESGQTIEDLKAEINEIQKGLREMVMGISFDSFLSNARDAIKEMRGDITKLGEFTEETLANAILEGFMYKDLAKVLEPLYNELSDAFIDGKADSAFIEGWRNRLEEVMTAAGERLEEIAEATGIDLDGVSGRNQTGKAGGFTAISQDQGTKLEGLFVSVQMHTASIDEQMEDVGEKMSQASEHLRKIEENTRKTAEKIEKVSDNIEKIVRDGIKTR